MNHTVCNPLHLASFIQLILEVESKSLLLMHVPCAVLKEAWDIHQMLLIGWVLKSKLCVFYGEWPLKPMCRSFSFSSYHFPSEFLRISSCINTVQRLTKNLGKLIHRFWGSYYSDSSFLRFVLSISSYRGSPGYFVRLLKY